MQSANPRFAGRLDLVRDQIATSITVELADFEFAPFVGAPRLGERGSQCEPGNLSAIALATAEAHQLFGDQLTRLLDELNRNLAA